MNILQQAEQHLNEIRRNYFSSPITYIRSAGKETYSLFATLGKTVFRTEDYTGMTTRIHGVDFIVAADDCPFIPKRGDVILCEGSKYEVTAPNGEDVWRWSSGNRQSRRIHAKEVAQ